MNKVRTNEGKIYQVDYKIECEPEKTYFYMVYAVNEQHARQIVESYDQDAEITGIEEQWDAISQHYGE